MRASGSENVIVCVVVGRIIPWVPDIVREEADFERSL